jgi:monooxygenase
MQHEDHVDVLIVGAGLSGIGAARHLQTNCPDRRYLILEGRGSIGGTWDLFRYPGIRSDSDMYTLGYSFKPWSQAKAIADGASILAYVRDTAKEGGIEKNIRFGHRVVRASWSAPDTKWTVVAEHGESRERVCFTCSFLFMCSGYYRYAAGYTPDFAGTESFQGRIVHPQHWPADLDVSGQRVIVIGSGATAVTLVPELAKTAAHVVLLQRSPTYIVARPAVDQMANRLRRWFPARLAYGLTRWKNVVLGQIFYVLSRRKPDFVRKLIVGGARQALGPSYDVGRHFTPRYNPWDQRLCLVPDGDLFKAIRRGDASVVTDTIDRFTERGVRLASGEQLQADLVVTATGLELEVLGGMEIVVDGERLDPATTFGYKGMMLSGVPNFAICGGYTNASWTLKSDLTAVYVGRLLNHLRTHDMRVCVPVNEDPSMAGTPWIDFSSGYVQRGLHRLPKQGSRTPWRLHQNYAKDLLALRFGALDDGVMRFSGAPKNR